MRPIQNTNHSRQTEMRNFILFILGKGVSVFGSSIYTFAIGLYVLKETGSALNFSVTLMLGTLPMVIFGPVAGVITDRFNKKFLVIGSDLLNGLLFMGLFLLASQGHLTLPVIYSATVCLTLSSTLFGIAMESYKPTLVSEKHLLRLNAQSKIIDSMAAIMGPILGGIAYALWPIATFLGLNALSFLVSGITECFFKPVDSNAEQSRKSLKRTAKSAQTPRIGQDVREAAAYVRGDQTLVEYIGIFVFLNFFLGFALEVPLPYIVTRVLKLPDGIYGAINAAFPVGMIAGAFWVERLMRRVDYRQILIFSVPIMGLAVMVMGLAPVIFSKVAVLYMMLMFVIGGTIALIDVPILYLLQAHVPENIRGRVFSLVFSAVKIVLPLSLIFAGVLIQHISVYWLPVSGGVVAFLFSALKMRK